MYNAFFLLLLLSKSAWAGNLTLTPSVSLTYQNTDNLTLTEVNEVSDNIIEIAPAVEILYESELISGTIQYQAQSLQYDKNSDNDETFQQLESLITAEIINDIFWLNLANNIDQRSISDTADQQQGNIFANENTTDVNNVIIQPLVKFRNSDINYEIIANLTEQKFDNDDIDLLNQLDSESENYGITINSDNNTRINWGVNYFDSQTDFDDESYNIFKNSEGLINIAFTSQILSTITVGKDDNEFETVNTEILDDNYWSVGLTWNPSNRLNLLISGGERFDSSNSNLSINYQGRKLSLSLNKTRELFSNGLNNIDPIGNPQNVITPQNNNVQLRDFNSLNLNYNQGNLQFNLSYTYDNRESQLIAGQEETDKNLTAGITWQLQSRITIIINHNKTNDEVPNVVLENNRLDKLSINTIEINRALSPNSDLSFLMRSQKRDSVDNTFDYNENGYQVSFSHRF